MQGYKSKKGNENIDGIRRERKFSKKALIYGGVGMGIVVLDTYLSKNVGVESFYKEFKELNPYEIVTNALFGISSMSTLIGGTIYGISHMFEEDKVNEKKNLGSKL